MTTASPLEWLLEPDNPSARYLALTTLLDLDSSDPEAVEARTAIPTWGVACSILDAQWPQGYWIGPGVGYSPKHKATVWQIIFLAALGAPRTESIDLACAYVLENSRLPDGRFSAHKSASGAVACLNGNLLRAMRQLGYEDPGIGQSLEALARMAARTGFGCRFNAASPRPSRMEEGLPCAWGAIKALGAFAGVPPQSRSPAIQAAIDAGTALLLDDEPAGGRYPTPTKPSPLWRKFGFPLGYTSDVLELLAVLGELGVRRQPPISAAVEVVRSKQDESGRWTLEYSPHNTWSCFGQTGRPSKWVTFRALQALKNWE